MRLILDCEPEDFERAIGAAHALVKYPESKDCITRYANNRLFSAKRTKLGISVKRIEARDPNSIGPIDDSGDCEL